jgi:hypothetical protein
VSDVEMSRLMLMRLGDGASGGRDPAAREMSKLSARLATETAGPC